MKISLQWIVRLSAFLLGFTAITAVIVELLSTWEKSSAKAIAEGVGADALMHVIEAFFASGMHGLGSSQIIPLLWTSMFGATVGSIVTTNIITKSKASKSNCDDVEKIGVALDKTYKSTDDEILLNAKQLSSLISYKLIPFARRSCSIGKKFDEIVFLTNTSMGAIEGDTSGSIVPETIDSRIKKIRTAIGRLHHDWSEDSQFLEDHLCHGRDVRQRSDGN